MTLSFKTKQDFEAVGQKKNYKVKLKISEGVGEDIIQTLTN